jgi:hypothetical protein
MRHNRKIDPKIKKRLQQIIDKLTKSKDPKKWAKDILADPNYTYTVGIAMAKKALDPNNLRGVDDDGHKAGD